TISAATTCIDLNSALRTRRSQVALEDKTAAVHDALGRADELPALFTQIIQRIFRQVGGDENAIFELAHRLLLSPTGGVNGPASIPYRPVLISPAALRVRDVPPSQG